MLLPRLESFAAPAIAKVASAPARFLALTPATASQSRPTTNIQTAT